MIHGIRNGLGWLGPAHRLLDWTKGCIAVTDPEMSRSGPPSPTEFRSKLSALIFALAKHAKPLKNNVRNVTPHPNSSANLR